jgi:hypothetical protein
MSISGNIVVVLGFIFVIWGENSKYGMNFLIVID